MIAEGRFTEAAMLTALRQVSDRIGVTCGDAELLQLTNNAVFALPSAGVIVRITRSHALHDRAAKVAQLAAWFADVDAPTIRLALTTEQPVEVSGLSATVWHYLQPTEPLPDVADLGRALRELHDLDPPPFPVPTWDPVDDARRRLRDAEALRPDHRVFLSDWCDRLQPRITELNHRGQLRVVHGDAHVGNLLRDTDGRVVFCDFDATCIGPWQVDLVAVPVGEARFGRPGTNARLVAAYGYDVTSDPDWPLLREVRELKMVVAAVPLLASAPGVADEFARRLASIEQRDYTRPWIPFAALNKPRGRANDR